MRAVSVDLYPTLGETFRTGWVAEGSVRRPRHVHVSVRVSFNSVLPAGAGGFGEEIAPGGVERREGGLEGPAGVLGVAG